LLYNYIPATYASANPLILTGFDSQLVLAYSKKTLAHSIDSLIRRLNLPITKQKNYNTELRPLIDSSIMAGYNIVKLNYPLLKKTSKLLLTIENQLAKALPADNFWLYVVDDVSLLNTDPVPCGMYRWRKI
jgi:hypothetical protein